MKRFLREPLLHFLVLGAALFVAYGAINVRSGGTDEIVVTASQIEHLTVGFTRSWRRSPTADELKDLVRNYVREEVYYRQAKEMRLDRDDPIIRRRLQQKLEFISEDIAAQTEPSDSDLNNVLRSQPENFRVGRKITFSHVYLSPELHLGKLDDIAEQLLIQLNHDGATADISVLGDRFLLGAKFEDMPISEVTKLFGTMFSDRLAELGIAKWQGPVKSGYGFHLVFVQERTDGRIPDLNEVREAVLREWKETQRNKANEDVYKKLLSRYSVTIEAPRAGDLDTNMSLAQR